MPKANAGDNSSLELLLDTMCNTFGAVMFIAISLLVVISMLGKVTSIAERQVDTEVLQNMRERLVQLENEYAQSRKMLELLKPFAERLKNDPRREILNRCMILKEENSRLENRLKILLLQQETEEALKRALQEKKDKLEQEASRQKELSETLEEKLKLMRKSISFISQALSNQKPESSLVFRHMQPSKDIPYFILLRQGRFWRIGPDTGPGDKILIHPDVSCTRVNNSYHCKPAVAGTVVLNEKTGELTREALDLLRRIPAGRFPSFQVYSDSAREMFLIREALKEKNIPHFFSTYTDDRTPGFVLLTESNVNYETN